MAHKKSERKRELDRRRRRRKKVLKARRKEFMANRPATPVPAPHKPAEPTAA